MNESRQRIGLRFGDAEAFSLSAGIGAVKSRSVTARSALVDAARLRRPTGCGLVSFPVK